MKAPSAASSTGFQTRKTLPREVGALYLMMQSATKLIVRPGAQTVGR